MQQGLCPDRRQSRPLGAKIAPNSAQDDNALDLDLGDIQTSAYSAASASVWL
jgi:hypothetical protein